MKIMLDTHTYACRIRKYMSLYVHVRAYRITHATYAQFVQIQGRFYNAYTHMRVQARAA